MTPSEPQPSRLTFTTPVIVESSGGVLHVRAIEREAQGIPPSELVERIVVLMENEGIVEWADSGHRERFLAATASGGIPLIDVGLLRDTPEDRALLERIGHSFANWAPGHSKEWAASLIGAIKAERTRPERMRAIYTRLSESSPAEEGAEPDEAAAMRWLAANDLYAVTHIHESKDCAECQAGVVPVEEGER